MFELNKSFFILLYEKRKKLVPRIEPVIVLHKTNVQILSQNGELCRLSKKSLAEKYD